MGLMFPLHAHAACTTPVGEAGDQFFNTTVSRMQYCDGTNWVNMGVSALSDNLGNHTATQALAMGNFKITGLATPTAAADAVTKAYVDGLVGGGGDNLGDHIATTVLRSDTNNTDDLGTTAIRWKDGWFAGAVTAGSFSGVGTSLTALNGSNITSGTVPTARLGSGTADASTYLRGDGTWAAPAGGGGGGATDIQQFDSSSTWTKPANAKLVHVMCWGGGGGGGRKPTYGGGGGGAGAYLSSTFLASDLPASVAITIGQGGAGAVVSGNGVSGTATTFGNLITAPGGTYGEGGGSNCASSNFDAGPGGIIYAGILNIGNQWSNGGSGGTGCGSNPGQAPIPGGIAGQPVGTGSQKGGAGGAAGGLGGGNGGDSSIAQGFNGTVPGGGGGATTSGIAGSGASGRCKVITNF